MHLLLINIKAFLIVFLSYFIINVMLNFEIFQNIIFFTKDFNPTVGSLLYLPIGAVLLNYLLYGKKVILIISASVISYGIYNELKSHILIGYSIVGIFGPLLAIYLVERFKLIDFKKFPNTPVKSLLFLCVVAAVINTTGKFIVYYSYPYSDAAISWFDGGPTTFLLTFLPGDIIGGIVFLLTSVFVIRYFHLEDIDA